MKTRPVSLLAALSVVLSAIIPSTAPASARNVPFGAMPAPVGTEVVSDPVNALQFVHGEGEFGLSLHDHVYEIPLASDPGIIWNTFLGGWYMDSGDGVAVDANGNVFVSGASERTWDIPPAPITPSGGFVAKLDNSGALLWYRFIGSNSRDNMKLALDGSGNVYVVGTDNATWGTPVRPLAGSSDVFAAKLDGNGTLLWNTFLGGAGIDTGTGIAVDGSGNVFVSGTSVETWGSPVRAHSGLNNAFAAKLDTRGSLLWNTFLGVGGDVGGGIAVDAGGNVHVVGSSDATWATPVRPFVGLKDAFAAKLNSGGTLLWNTFLGGESNDTGRAIAVDSGGNVCVLGNSGSLKISGAWGTPVRDYSSGVDTFVAMIGSSGSLLWNTFLGGEGGDMGTGIEVNASGNIDVIGSCNSTWGSPVRAYSEGNDAYLAEVDGSGALMWNTFLGSFNLDWGSSLTVDGSGNIYAVGGSGGTWGAPIRSYAFETDAFVVKLNYDSTLATPTVNTQAVSAISITTAIGNGTVESDGGSAITERGIVWDTDGSPTILDGKVIAAGTLGVFEAPISGLTVATLYHVRAYATNAVGTAYGNEVTFSTLASPTVTTQAVSGIGSATATGNGTVVSDGGSAILERGIVWNRGGSPTMSDAKATAPGTTGVYSASITGLVAGTLYHVRAYAINAIGTTYGDEVTFTSLAAPTVTTQAVTSIGSTTAVGHGTVVNLGVPNPTQHGIVWKTSPGPTTSDSKTADGPLVVTGTFTSNMTGLSAGTLYYVRAYATNAAGTVYGDEVTFMTLAAPTVTTQAMSNIGDDFATGNGTVVSDGGTPVTQRGVVWNSSGNPTIADNKATVSGTTGAFSALVTGLTAGTTYRVRAYATNAVGTSYGGEVTVSVGWIPFTPGEHAVTLDLPGAGGPAAVNATITFSGAGYKVDAWGSVMKVGEDYRVDAVISRWTGLSEQMVKSVSHAYVLGTVTPGSHSFNFYANGTLVKTIPFVTASPASTSGTVAITSISTFGAPSAGKVVLVQVVVQNKGRTRDSFTVELIADGKTVGTVSVKDMAPGTSRRLYLRWTPAMAGNVKLSAAVVRDGVSGERLEQKTKVVNPKSIARLE